MVRRKIDRVELRPTEPNGYEFEVGRFDYHLRFEDGTWCLDQFQRDSQDPNEAHLRSIEVESLADGVNYALDENET